MGLTDRPNTAAIADRVSKATMGPWVVDGETRQTVRPRWDVQPHTMTGTGFSRREDAAFVAHARSDVPDLLTWIYELEMEVGALRARCGLKPCGCDPAHERCEECG